MPTTVLQCNIIESAKISLVMTNYENTLYDPLSENLTCLHFPQTSLTFLLYRGKNLWAFKFQSRVFRVIAMDNKKFKTIDLYM